MKTGTSAARGTEAAKNRASTSLEHTSVPVLRWVDDYYSTHPLFQGYDLSEDGHSCVDQDECLSNNGHGPCQVCGLTKMSFFEG